ncbi:MAG: helix-hairpin-helix domain-containing protein, partial [Myxococcota bacterium]
MAKSAAATKREVVDALKELAELTALDEGSVQSFRVRAYEAAARGVMGCDGDLKEMSVAQLTKLDGVGKSTAQKIREWVEGGAMAKLDKLRAAYPRSVAEMSHVPGVGPKAVKKLRAELGIESVAELKRAALDQKIRGLSGFGAKSEEKILKSLERLGLDGARRTPIAKAMPLAMGIVEELSGMIEVERVAYCGSLRRFRETVGDLDIVVAASGPSAPMMEYLVGRPDVSDVLVRGATKTSVSTNKGLQIDLRVVKPEQFGAALLYFTGSKAHNIRLRQRALERGWTLNEYALEDSETKEVIASETEEAIYAALDLPFIPPELREDWGEFGERPLVAPIERSAIRGDLHVHTDLSGDGRSPLDDMVRGALDQGYEYLAITEHAEALPLQGVGPDELLNQRKMIAAKQEELGDALRILHGVELNIGPAGELDYDDAFRRGFDWCLAS